MEKAKLKHKHHISSSWIKKKEMTKQPELSKADLGSIKVSCNADGHIQSRLFKVSLEEIYFFG